MPDFLFRNTGRGRFEETALVGGVAVPIHGKPTSSIGAEFEDYDNDGGGQFSDRTGPGRLARATLRRSGWSNVLEDLDNDGWKDLFTANSHVNDCIDAFEAQIGPDFRSRGSTAARGGRFEL